MLNDDGGWRYIVVIDVIIVILIGCGVVLVVGGDDFR